MQPVLYRGTNSKAEIYFTLDGNKLVNLCGKWTTHPGEAMDFAFNIARKYDAEMLLLVLPKWNLKNFRKISTQGAINRGELSDWYVLQSSDDPSKIDVYSPASIEQKNVEIYSQKELRKFIKKYCLDDLLERNFVRHYIKKLSQEESESFLD